MIRIEEDKKNPIAEKAKKGAKKIIKRILTLKIVLILIIIIAVITLLSAITWFFFKDSGVWTEKEKGRPNIYTSNVKMDPQEGITIDKEAIVKQALLDLGLSEDQIKNMSEQDKIKKLKLSEKLNRTINSFDDCTAAEILWCLSDEYSKFIKKPEQLEKLLMAELVTQYPYIDGLDESKTNGVIKFYRYANTGEVDFKSSYKNAGQDEEEQQEEEQEEEESTEQEIDASKIFYIGDSWMAGLSLQKYVNSDYFCCRSGAKPSYYVDNFNEITSKMKNDSSAIVMMLGLNGTTSQTESMKKLIDLVTEKYPDKQLYVLKVFHVGKSYKLGNTTASSMNAGIDQYNSAISSYCDGKENVIFTDTTTGILDGEGYLANQYLANIAGNDRNFHLNNKGYQQWYYNIEQALRAGGGARTNITDQEYYRIKYIDSAKFDEMYAEYESSGNREVFKYYTLDEEGNAKIATWTKVTGNFTTQNGNRSIGEIQSLYDSRYQSTSDGGAAFTEYTASITSINYKSMSEKYTMPFEYLWALLVEGEDYDFVERVANLTYNTEFNIGIYDCVNTSTDVQKNYYTRTVSKSKSTTNSSGETTTSTTYKSIPCVDTSTITTEIDMVTYDIAYANTWIVEVWTKYLAKNFSDDTNKDVTIMEGQKNNLSESDLKDKLNEFDENKDKDKMLKTEEGEETLVNTPNLKETEKTEITETKNMTVNEQTSVDNSYERSTSDVREKVDIDPSTGDNFVKALRESNNAFRLLSNNGTIKWLCEVLEENEDTKDMVDLTKALIQKAIHPDEEIDFDFSIFSPGSFSSFSSVYGNTLEEKVWFALKDMGYSDIAVAGAMGNFDQESQFRANNLEDTYEKKLGYTDESYTEAVDNGSYSLERFISDHDKKDCGAGYGLAQWTFYTYKEKLYKFAKEKQTSIGDEDMQLEFLINTIKDSQNDKRHNAWKNSTTPEEAATNFCSYYERGTGAAQRRNSARIMYEKWKGAQKTDDGYVSGGSFTKGGISSDQEAKQLENTINTQWLHTQVHHFNVGGGEKAHQQGPFAKWWEREYNGLEKFQCTWWAYGRASQYLEANGTKYKKYPTVNGKTGNGGEWITKNQQNGWFNYGKQPKPNSLIVWHHGDYGHVAYVEGVTSDGIYISHAGNGSRWFGVQKIPLSGKIWNGYTLQGYIYLDEPR